MVISLFSERPALVAPAGYAARSDHELLERLAKSEICRSYRAAFQTMTGLPCLIQPAVPLQPLQCDSPPTNSFCVLLRAKNEQCPTCLRLQEWIDGGARGEAQTFESPPGSRESAVPIRLGERTLGFLRTGRALLPSPSLFQPGRKPVATRHGEIIDCASCTITPDHYASGLKLLTIFAQHLALLGNQLMITEISVESPLIAKARLFIALHHGEELSLADVAQAVHMSPFYFCKRFKRETGLGFTVYLARMRVEKVKQALLQRHTRITEAAFGAGFQSVSQFNRMFRHIVGESPSDYRMRLGHFDGV